MKLNLIIILMILVFTSCRTSTPRYIQLIQNYDYVNWIIQNPDSLPIWVKDSIKIKNAIFKYVNNKPENIEELMNKIKDNNFKDGYTYYYDRLDFSRTRTFLWHRVWIRSNYSGKKLFFEFHNKDGNWEIDWIGLHITMNMDMMLE